MSSAYFRQFIRLDSGCCYQQSAFGILPDIHTDFYTATLEKVTAQSVEAEGLRGAGGIDCDIEESIRQPPTQKENW